ISCRYHEPRPPFCAAGGTVNLDAAAVDEQLRGHAVDPGKVGEDTLPHAALGPAPETVVERLLRSVDVLRTIAPAPAALQRLDDPRQHSPVVDPGHAARVRRQERLDPRPLLIRKPEEIRHRHPSSTEAGESHLAGAGNPVYGSGPKITQSLALHLIRYADGVRQI